MTKFKAGDLVICMKTEGTNLDQKTEYKVLETDGCGIRIESPHGIRLYPEYKFKHAGQPEKGDKVQVTYITTYDPQHPLPEGADVTVLERAVQLPTTPGSVVTTQVATFMLLTNGRWVDTDGMYRTDEAVRLTLKLGGEVVYAP